MTANTSKPDSLHHLYINRDMGQDLSVSTTIIILIIYEGSEGGEYVNKKRGKEELKI